MEKQSRIILGLLREDRRNIARWVGAALAGCSLCCAPANAQVTSIDGQTGAFSCSSTIDCASATIAVKPNSLTNTQVSNSAAIASSKLSYTAPGTGATARSLSGKFDQIVDLLDYGNGGPVCNGVVDDKATFDRAIAALGSSNRGAVLLPALNCLASAAITVPDRTSLIGQGGATLILSTNVACNVFDVTGGLVLISGMQFGATVTCTSGSFITVSGSGLFRNLTMSNGYVNFTSNGAKGWTLDDLTATNTRYRGIVCTGASDLGVIERVIVSGLGVATSSDAGYWTDRCGDIQVRTSQFLGFNKGIGLEACGSPCDIAGNLFSHVVLDHNDQHGVYISAIGTCPPACASVSRNFFDHVSMTSGRGNGVTMTTAQSGRIDGVYFSGINCNDNLNVCMDVTGNVKNLNITSGQIAGNSGAGINIGAGVSDFTIMGTRIGNAGSWGNNNAGIVVNSGASNNYIITLNNLLGNTSGAIFDSGTGTNKIVSNNIQ